VKAAKELLPWLDSLPVSLLIELQAGGLEEHLHRIINRADYWQRHVKVGKPSGEGAASFALRRALTALITTYWPGPPNPTEEQKRFWEKKRRNWVAFACREIGARFPHQKKHRRQFVGERSNAAKDPVAAEPSEAERR